MAPRLARLALLLLLALAPRGAGATARRAAPADQPGQAAADGARLYREGVLPDGRPLRGLRDGGAGVEGLAAACATCHRRSGLGSWEGQTIIPPILGRYLFRPGARNQADLDLPHVPGYAPRRGAYTAATLARAIREGIDPEGRRLGFLMPRYPLDPPAMAALLAYLQGLGGGAQPGVERDTLHFATVVTPDADPVARRGMLDVLRGFFADKNAGWRGTAPALQSSRGVMYRVSRRWRLHVWELTGPPEAWEAELRAHLAETPVLAVVSGLGGATWAPVHRFCEAAGLPCLLPNVDVPEVAEGDFYPVYFSRGVLLEAGLVARALAASGAPRARRLVQVYRRGEAGEEAARSLAGEAAASGLAVEARPLDPAAAAGPALAAALGGLGSGDAVALWLRPGDLSALPATPPHVAGLYLSGLLGSLEEAPLPPAWREAAQLTYPFDLPEARRVRLGFPLSWFRIRHVPVVAERVQVDTWLACSILSEALGHMLDAFVGDYLVERVEALVSHRLVNGYYPRLGLGPGQRFASKGGYLVRLARAGSPGVVAEGGWVVP